MRFHANIYKKTYLMKYEFFFFCVLCLSFFIQELKGDDISDGCRDLSCCVSQPIGEITGGYFTFSNPKMRKIYNRGGGEVQLRGSYPIWDWLQAYGAVGYQQCNGRSIHGKQKTTIQKVPVSLGVKSVFTICRSLQSYFTLGPRYLYLHQNNHSDYVKRHISRSGFGGFVNTGLVYEICPDLIIDIVGEYAYERVCARSTKHHNYGRDIQVGGYAYSVGLGYVF